MLSRTRKVLRILGNRRNLGRPVDRRRIRRFSYDPGTMAFHYRFAPLLMANAMLFHLLLVCVMNALNNPPSCTYKTNNGHVVHIFSFEDHLQLLFARLYVLFPYPPREFSTFRFA